MIEFDVTKLDFSVRARFLVYSYAYLHHTPYVVSLRNIQK